MTAPRTSLVRSALAAPRRGVVGFFRGLGFAFRGAKRVYLEEPGLARYWIVPIAVTSIALLGSMALIGMYGSGLSDSVWATPTGDDWVAELARGAHWVFVGFVHLVLAVVALVVTMLVGSIVAAPFNARLGEVLDERVTGYPTPPFAISRVVMDVVRTLVIEIVFFVVNTILFFASLAFPPATPVLGIVGMILAGYYFAIAYLEIPLVARDASLGDRWRFWTANPMAILGYGTGVGLFLFVPIVNLLFMPAAVAGGVLLFAELSGSRRDDTEGVPSNDA